MIITRTPHRVSLIGGGTDFPAWYNKHGGAVIGFAISQYCYIICRHLPPYSHQYKHRLVYSNIELVDKAEDVKHPAVKAIIKDWEVQEGLEIHHAGDVPARAGLGSSSAFSVGLLHAICALRGAQVNKLVLAKEAIRIEQSVIGEAVGSQDQCFAALGGLNRIDFSKDTDPKIQPLPLTAARITELLECLMLVFIPGTQRVAAQIEAQKIANLEDHRLELRMLRALVDETEELLISPEKDITKLGEILDASWQIKRTLAADVSNKALDGVYAAALEGGAVGGKLVGAGGGGCFLFVVPVENRARLAEVLNRLDPPPVEIPLAIDREGSRLVVYEPNSWH
jgi:D-glycero-alpha-D-manno-heptose-7-phosphate kinase